MPRAADSMQVNASVDTERSEMSNTSLLRGPEWGSDTEKQTESDSVRFCFSVYALCHNNN